MKKAKLLLAAPLAACLLLASCSKEQGWTVSGTIDGAAGRDIVLESVDNGVWSPLDTVTVADNGSFRFARERAAYPDIFRLTVDGRSVYFPIDSIENVTVDGTLADLGNGATIGGSPSAEMMNEINKRLNAALAAEGEFAIASDSILKRDIAEIISADWGGIVAYYAISKTVGAAPLFDPARPFDRRVIVAVANSYVQDSPNDPRTRLLERLVRNNRYLYDPAGKIVAQEIPFFEIALLDRDGRERSLTEEWQKGKVMVLNFTVYGAEESPAFNMALAEVYDKYRNDGLEIFQVVCDDDEVVWRNASKNIPWISVYNLPGQGTQNLLRYNVQSIPTTFVIDRSGETVERVENIADLGSVVAKLIR